MWSKLIPDFLRGRMILSLLLSFIVGIVIAEFSGISLAVSGWIAIAALLLSLLLFRWGGLAIFLPLALSLGMLMCSGDKAAVAAFDYEDGNNIIVCGKIVAMDEREENWRAQLAVDSIDGATVHCADIYLYGEGIPPGVGSTIEARGTVFSPEPYANANAFDYNDYLTLNGIAGSVSTQFTGKVTVLSAGPSFYPAKIGEWLRDGFDQAAAGLNDLQKALVYGVFLGDKSGLDYQMKNALGLTGSLHAFAVSGLHVGYIVALALLLAGNSYRRRILRFVLCVVMLLVYISLTGAVPSVLRASIMSVCLLAASLFNEQDDRVTAISLAALICLIIHPRWLFSAGFLLSFAAAGGIIAFTPMFGKLFSRLPAGINGFFSVTFAATLATLPLVCYYFYHISWLGWILSPAVILAAGATVILSFLGVLLAIFSPWLAGILLEAAAYAIEPVYWLCEWVSSWRPAASVTGAVPAWTVIVFICLIAFLPYLLKRCGKIATSSAIIVLVLLFSLVAPRTVFPGHNLNGKVAEVTFIDVGQGDCALIVAPDGKTVLIDGGGITNNPGSIGEYSLLPYLKSRGIDHIDMMINSHPHDDHTDGLLSVLEYLDTEQLLCSGLWADDGINQRLLTAAENNGAEIVTVAAGDSYPLGDYLHLSFYHPDDSWEALSGDDADANDASLVCEVSIGEIDFLFTGDIGGELLATVCDQYAVEAEIIKLPHHGSKTGYDEELAEILASEVAVISVGEDNSYGHPAAKVVEYWQEYGEVYRTDLDGSVVIYTNGAEYQISTYY